MEELIEARELRTGDVVTWSSVSNKCGGRVLSVEPVKAANGSRPALEIRTTDAFWFEWADELVQRRYVPTVEELERTLRLEVRARKENPNLV